MKDSTLLLKQANPKLLTWGHETDDNGHPFPSKVFPYNRIHSPSSNLHSNARDMARWTIANMNRGELDGKRILKESTYDVMWKPITLPGGSAPPRQSPAGISWFLGKHREHTLISHGGGDTGYATDLAMLPDQKISVVWMANCDWIGRAPITGAALDTALGLEPQPITMQRSIVEAMFSAYQEHGVDAALQRYRSLKKLRPDTYDFGEGQLNGIGTFLLRGGHAKEAIQLLQLNTEEYPSSANARARLAAAYAADGNRESAIANYEKALELNPNLTQAAEALKKLKGQ